MHEELTKIMEELQSQVYRLQGKSPSSNQHDENEDADVAAVCSESSEAPITRNHKNTSIQTPSGKVSKPLEEPSPAARPKSILKGRHISKRKAVEIDAEANEASASESPPPPPSCLTLNMSIYRSRSVARLLQCPCPEQCQPTIRHSRGFSVPGLVLNEVSTTQHNGAISINSKGPSSACKGC